MVSMLKRMIVKMLGYLNYAESPFNAVWGSPMSMMTGSEGGLMRGPLVWYTVTLYWAPGVRLLMMSLVVFSCTTNGKA